MRLGFQFIIFIFLLSNNVISQDLGNFLAVDISYQDGLPSNEVYHVVQDLDGYLWFATSNGISRYNGVHHKIFDTRSGIPSQSVFHLFPQKDTSIVGVCSSGEFFKIKDETVSLILDSDTSKKYVKPALLPFSYYQDDRGNQYIGTRNGYYCFDEKSNLVHNDNTEYEHKSRLNFWRVDSTYLFSYNTIATIFPDSLQIEQDFGIISALPSTFSTIYNTKRSLYPSISGEFNILHIYNELILVHNTEKTVSFTSLDADCITTYSSNNEVFAGLAKSGVIKFARENDSLIFLDRYFFGLSVSSVLKSSGDIYWFSTLEDGCRMINPTVSEVFYSAPENENITSIEISKNDLSVGFESGIIYTGGKYLNLFKTKIFDLKKLNRMLFISSNGLELLSEYNQNSEALLLSRIDDKIGARKLVEINDSMLIFQARFKIAKFDLNSSKSEEVNALQLNGYNEYTDLFRIDKICYAISSDFIAKFSPENINEITKINSDKKIIYGFEHEKSTCFLSQDMELSILKSNKLETLFRFPIDEFVNGAVCALYKHNILHISTSKGVYSWLLPTRDSKKISLVNFEPIPLVRIIKIHENSIYFATAKEIYKKSLLDFKVHLPKVIIESINTIGRKSLKNKKFILDYNRNDLEIVLDVISFSRAFLNFRYKLEGHNSKYLLTKEFKINYSDLPPGDYVFKVSATSDGFNYSPEQSIKIHVSSPFWMQWWFWFLMLFLLIIISFILIRFRIKRIRKKLELDETISKLKGQALTAQLNPHLVFNVLNSIQGLISSGNREEANVYIARFSKFLRNSLKYSKVVSIPLKEEIKMIEQYVALEKLRFQDLFSFNIHLNDVDVSTHVPPLLLQPLIENSIKHGIMPNNGVKGEIHLNFKDEGNYLLLIIKDNGAGLKKDYVFGDGLRITRERLKVLSPLNELVIMQDNNPTLIVIKIIK